MLDKILAESRSIINLLISFSDKYKYFHNNYLPKFLQLQVLTKRPCYYFPKIVFILLIFLYSLLNTSLAYTEICSFESSQSCELYDCKGNSWYIDNSAGYPQSPSLHSGSIQNGGESSLCRNVTGPATINFWWRAECINSCLDELFFLVDGQKKYVCKSTKWENSSYTIRDKGNHTISWIYRKIRSYPEYSGGGWIDNLSIEYYSNWSPNVIGELNASVYAFERIGNPILVTINPTLLTINATNILMNSSIVRLNTTKMLTDRFSIATNVSNLEINSSNMSTNIYGNIKIPKISKINVEKVLNTNSNISLQIELLWPQNNTEYEINDSISFKYRLHTDENIPISNCTLCLNGKEITGNMSDDYEGEIVRSFDHTFSKNHLGTNKWHIRCYDNFLRVYESLEYRSIVVHLNSRIINVTNETDLNDCNFSSINDAIYFAPPQSTIMVYKKINREHIIINKPINLVSMNNSTIYNEGNDPEIILINASDISVKGFELTANRAQLAINITNNELSNLDIYDNHISGGFKAEGVKNITIAHNVIAKNNIRNAIHLRQCSEISIINNSLKGHSEGVGAFMENSNLTTKFNFINNTISNTGTGLKICTSSKEGNSLLKDYIRSNNNSFIGISRGYEVRFACD